MTVKVLFLYDTSMRTIPGVGCLGRKGPKVSREVVLFVGKKSFEIYSLTPVPQSDTGRWDEYSKANGRRVVKELGKMTL